MLRRVLRALDRARPSALTSEQQALLEQMRADNMIADARYHAGPGRGWQKLVVEFDMAFRREGIRDVQQQSFNARFASNPPGSRAYYTIACNLMYLRLLERDRFGVFDRLRATQAPLARSNEVELDGLVLTWDLLISTHVLLTLAEIDESFLSTHSKVLDLGAGWGRVGHALLRVCPLASYICADLPETLLISQTYLPTTLPDTPVRTYEQNRVAIDLDTPGLHFIGSHHLAEIRDQQIDLFLNIASFQEMQNSQVEGYLSDISRLCRGVFYTRQIKHTNTKDGFVVSGSEYYPFPQCWERLFVRDVPEWPGYFEAALRVG